jgi:hypothetical protein
MGAMAAIGASIFFLAVLAILMVRRIAPMPPPLS